MGPVRRHAVTAAVAGVLLTAVGYVVLLSPWHATATVAGTGCPHELTWHSDLYAAQERTAEPGASGALGALGAPLAEPAYDAGCADRSALPEKRVLTVYRLGGVAPRTAFVDASGRVWARVDMTAGERDALDALPAADRG